MSYLLAYNPYNTNLFMKNRSIDPAAQAYFNATGITGDAQQQAINSLVKSLKQSGLWSKMKAVYPFVTDNRNLLGYTEAFDNGAWIKENATISANATTAPNGTLTADKLQEDNTTNKHDFYFDGIGGNGIASTIGQTYTISIYAKAAERNFMQIAFGTGQVSGNPRVNFNISNGTITAVDSGITATIESVGNGWYRCNSSVTAATGFLTFITQTQTSGTAARFATYLGTTGSGIFTWGAQFELGSTATTYQPIATTQQAFISNQFKYNLKDPQDTDAAFRLVFNGGWSFSSTGATPNGVNGYADTKLVPSTNFNTTTYNHLSFYSRTSAASSGFDYNIGSSTTGAGVSGLIIRRSNDASFFVSDYASGIIYRGSGTPSIPIGTVNNGAGFFIGTQSATNTKLFRSNALVSQDAQVTLGYAIPSQSFFIGASNDSGSANYYANRQAAFATIGDGLTDDDATNLYYYTQVFQTTLGRQVGSPAYALPAVSDINAKLYLSAIGSTTNSTLNNAVDTFIKGLKADGIYSKMKAVYPFATDNRNLLSYTEDFSNAYWTKAQVTFSPNAITAPNGTLTAGLITVGSVNGEHNIYNPSGVNTIANQTYTHSIYVKKGTARYVCAWIYYTTAGGGPFATFDLDSQTLVASGNGLGTYVGSNIENAGNGWYRISVSGYGNYTSIIVSVPDIRISGSLIPGGANSYMGTGQTLYSWGAQLELGSTATAYQPILGSQQSYISNQFKYNMVNPQDDDSAFRLVFNGGWTHSAQGATPNGVNAYADTKLNPTIALTNYNAHSSTYNRTNSDNVGWEIGLTQSVGVYANEFLLAGRKTDFSVSGLYDFGNPNGEVKVASSSAVGFFQNSITSNTSQKLYKNGVQIGVNTNTNNSTPANGNIYLSAVNDINTTAIAFSIVQQAFASIGNGLTDTEAANLYTRVQTFNQALSRQVGVPIVSDADAQAFLNSAEITNITQANAINTLVTDLKAQGLWTKMKAIYPFVGGTASTHKWNLKDPRDLDAAYRLVFNGGWTHSSTGATPNGTNAYADTYLVPSSSLSTSSAHFAKYNRTNDLVGNKLDGSFSTSTTSWFQHNYTSANGIIGNGASATYTPTDTRGLFIATRTATNSIKVFRNTTNVATNTDAISTMPNAKVLIGARNSSGTIEFYNSYQAAFASLGDGLTDAEALALFNAVNNYQVALSRNV